MFDFVLILLEKYFRKFIQINFILCYYYFLHCCFWKFHSVSHTYRSPCKNSERYKLNLLNLSFVTFISNNIYVLCAWRYRKFSIYFLANCFNSKLQNIYIVFWQLMIVEIATTKNDWEHILLKKITNT